MIYIMTKRGLQSFWQKAYEDGLLKGYELGKGMSQDEGSTLTGIPYSIGPEAFNFKFRRQLDDILKQKGVGSG